MNKIDTKVTDEDSFRAKNRRKSDATRAEEILQTLKQSCPFGTTFIQDIPTDKRQSVEAELQKHFENWANSWIAPICREIIARAK